MLFRSASIAPLRYPELMKDVDKRDHAMAWMLDELTAEDSRNSLEGLGVIRIEPTDFIRGMQMPKVRSVISRQINKLSRDKYPWLDEEDFAILATVFLETLRERGAIRFPEGVDILRQDAPIA